MNSEFKLFTNGKIYSFSDEHDIYRSMLVRDGTVLHVSKDDLSVATVRQFFGSSAHIQCVDLGQKTLIPSFCDTHLHFLQSSLHLKDFDLSNVMSYASLLQVITAEVFHCRKNGKKWIIGLGYDVNLWPDAPRELTNRDLNDICDIPLALFSKDYHSALLNRKAIEAIFESFSSEDLLKYDIDEGSFHEGVMRQTDGEYTGLFRENAMRYVSAKIALLQKKSEHEVMLSMIDFMKYLNSFGITSVTDCASISTEAAFPFLQRIAHEQCTVRTGVVVSADNLDSYLKIGLTTGFGSDVVKISGVKLLYDGSLGSKSAYMYSPFDQTQICGMKNYSDDYLHDIMEKACAHGIGVVFHGIGDRACAEVASLLAEYASKYPSVPMRFEHAQTLTDETLDLLTTFPVDVVMQPLHIDQDIKTAKTAMADRLGLLYRFRSLVERRIKVSFSSDCPVAHVNPWFNVYSACTHAGFHIAKNEILNPAERISRFDALRCATVNAHSASLFHRSGLLLPGYFADCIVCSKDPLTCTDEDLLAMKVSSVFLSGRCVYTT